MSGRRRLSKTDAAARYLDRYLARIGDDGPRDPSIETLRRLHRAHLLAVPFENLSIHRGEPIELDETWILDKIVERRRGGFCYELNGAFSALLRVLGFSVDRLAARVYDAHGEPGIPFDHMALRVRLEREWLADVGFGDCFIEPLPLTVGEVDDVRRRYRLRAAADGMALDEHHPEHEHDRWKPQYTFSLEPHALADFEPGCRYHQTSPDSPFTKRRVFSRLTETGRYTLSEGREIVTSADGVRTETALDAADFEARLDRALR